MAQLLHPELFEGTPGAEGLKTRLMNRAVDIEAAAGDASTGEPDLTIVIRALNEADALERMFEDIKAQEYKGEIETIVVDNESADRTRQVARANGAEVVRLARADFSYPKALNLGFEAASHSLVYSTVAHANFSTDQQLRGGVGPFAVDRLVAGVYSRRYLAGARSSVTEQASALLVHQVFTEAGYVGRIRLGTLANVSALVSKPVWRQLGRFDESYAIGGEDTVMAKRMLALGYRLYQEPLMATHHTHGLELRSAVRQGLGYVASIHSPHELDLEAMRRRRPHLDFTYPVAEDE